MLKNTTTKKLIIFGTIRRNQFIKMSEPTFTAKNKNKEKTRKPQKIGTLPCFVSVFL